MFFGKLSQGVGDIASRHSHKVVNNADIKLTLKAVMHLVDFRAEVFNRCCEHFNIF